MVTKPEVAGDRDQWGQILNDALDSLQAQADAKLPLSGGTVSGTLTVSGTADLNGHTHVNDILVGIGTTTSQVVMAARDDGDTARRWRLTAGGVHEWGDGATSPDVSLQRPSTAQLRVTPSANASASSSVGGALNLTNSSSTGAGLVVYSTQAAPSGHLIVARANNATFSQAAIYAEYVGTSHAVSINHQGTGSNSSALNVASNNTAHSALGVSGQETGRGTLKVTHTGTGSDASASALSIDLAGTGTAAQGIFLTSTSGGTTGPLLHLRNGGTGALAEIAADGRLKFGSGTGATDVDLYRSAADVLRTDDDFAIGTAGKGLRVAEGSNARMGTATLVAGAATVSNTSVTANSRIFLTSQVDGGTPGWLRVSARTAATSFTITSSSGTDTSTVAWLMVEPA